MTFIKNIAKLHLQVMALSLAIAPLSHVADAADITLLTENPVIGANYELLDLGNSPALSAVEMGSGFTTVKKGGQGDSLPLRRVNGSIYLGEAGDGTYRDVHLRATWLQLPITKVIQVTGPIEKGDTERLRELVGQSGFSNCEAPGFCPYNNTISLNSPGGNLIEALTLGKYISEQNFATLLERDAICESACALAFLGGFTNYEGFFFPRRYVHETARLGIHRPYFQLPERNYSSAEVAQVVQVVNQGVIQATSYLLKVGVGLDFLQTMYDTPGSEMYHLAPLEMSANQIFVLGERRKVGTLTRREIFSYCANIYRLEFASDSEELLANLQTNGSAFITFVAGKDFICSGIKRISTDTWFSHICSGKTCGLEMFDLYPDGPVSQLPTPLEELSMSTMMLPIGAAFREFRHRSVLLQYIRLFAEDGDFEEFAEIPYTALSAPVPAPYCGQIDGYDPALVLSVQDLLNRTGISVGKPDGAAGPNTRRGIREYNKANLGRDSDMIDQNLLVALGAAPDVARPYELCP